MIISSECIKGNRKHEKSMSYWLIGSKSCLQSIQADRFFVLMKCLPEATQRELWVNPQGSQKQGDYANTLLDVS